LAKKVGLRTAFGFSTALSMGLENLTGSNEHTLREILILLVAKITFIGNRIIAPKQKDIGENGLDFDRKHLLEVDIDFKNLYWFAVFYRQSSRKLKILLQRQTVGALINC